MKRIFCLLGFCPLLAAAGSLERGLKAKAAGDLPLAERELETAVRQSPRNAEAWFHYGTVLGWRERHDKALAALERGLALAPGDYDLRMARARVLAWKGEYALASQALAGLARENPGDDDVRVMQGRVAGWSGRKDDAETHYQTVLARSPEHIDALTGMGDLARDRGHTREARDFYNRALAVDDTPDIRQRLENLGNGISMRWDTGVTASTFAGSSRSDWWSIWTQLGARTGYGTFWGRIEQGERFGEQDTLLEAGWENEVAEGLRIRLLAGGAPDASWAPEWFAEGGLHWRPAEAFPAAVVELRHTEYVPRGVLTLRTGLDHTMEDGWKISARWIHQEFENGEPTDGWLLALEKEYASGFAWRLGAAAGAESLDGRTLETGTDVLRSRTWFGGVRGPFAEHWGWRVDLEYEDVRGGVDRTGASVGVFHTF